MLKGASRKDQDKFFTRFFGLYWQQFQWDLPIDRDPYPDLPPPPAETPEVLERKGQIVEETQKVSSLKLRNNVC